MENHGKNIGKTWKEMERHVGTTSGLTHRFGATADAPRSDAMGMGRTLSLKNTLRQAADLKRRCKKRYLMRHVIKALHHS